MNPVICLRGTIEDVRIFVMSGEKNLAALLQNIHPEMQDGVFVFCSLPHGHALPPNITPVSLFREQEGTAFVIRREEAQKAGLSYEFPSRLITLTVHSALDAVGFLAAVTGRLAQAGISVNPVSGFYHDHLFVPEARAEEALRLLAVNQRGQVAVSRPEVG
jgi:uncharacterized protein